MLPLENHRPSRTSKTSTAGFHMQPFHDKSGAGCSTLPPAAGNGVQCPHQHEGLLVSDPIDPTQPTAAAPGSPAKIAVLEARALAGLPLFLPGDAVGLRHRVQPPRPTRIALRKKREWQLIQVLNGHPQSAKKLARLCDFPLRWVHYALTLLREAGVVESSSRGYRLAQVPP
jgi:hypothetical protein